MRRIETYVGQQVYEWAFSAQAQYTMTGIAKVCSALFGVGGTVNGLACTPTGPATMAVQLGAGEVYQIEPLEATACGTLPQNTSSSILKQGIQLGTVTTATFAAPTTSGQSIAYLIETQYQDSDISLDPTTGNSPVVLQFFNSTNPTSPWSGPNNSGSTSNTFRDGVVAYQIKAGTAATTGSQVTPSPDTGWIGIWVVTVPFGATSLTSSNIAQYTGSPILPNGILQSILTSNLTYGVDNGSANTYQATFPIPVATLTDGMDVWVKIKTANTGASTFTPNPGVVTASPVIGAAHSALQGGELIAGGRANLIWRQDVTSWVLVECTGAAIQIAPATASQHAMQLGQATGRLLNVQIFNTPGAFTYTPTPGATTAIADIQGGGGQGGGSPAATSSTAGFGTGGHSGSRAVIRFSLSGVTSIAGTVGAAGSTAGTGAPGQTGGTSSLGTLASCPGGPGGGPQGPTPGPIIAGNSTTLPNPTIGAVLETILTQPGNAGMGIICINSGVAISGTGGISPGYSGGIVGSSGTGTGASGSQFGQGGSGSFTASSGAAQVGGAGVKGQIVIYEYA